MFYEAVPKSEGTRNIMSVALSPQEARAHDSRDVTFAMEIVCGGRKSACRLNEL